MSGPAYTNNSAFAVACREKATLLAEYKAGGGIHNSYSTRMQDLEGLLLGDGRLGENVPALSPTRLRQLEWPDGEALVKKTIGYTGTL